MFEKLEHRSGVFLFQSDESVKKNEKLLDVIRNSSTCGTHDEFGKVMEMKCLKITKDVTTSC